MPISNKFSRAKPYNIVMGNDDNATIDMYGEVVDTRPVDWWTGEPISGNFIQLDEFLKDLEQLKDKKSVTIHINSVGGDFYAGLSIYNRLRTLGVSITTVVDGLAASAGSIIFMAGDKGKRKVHAGSNLMIHGVLSFLYGYYNAVDLKNTIKTLEAHNKAAVAAYMEATGLDQETVKAAMSKDTYMVGQEAVDAGWADEVISAEGEEPVAMKLTPDKSYLMVNGMAVAARSLGQLPKNIQQMTAEEFAAFTQNDAQPEQQVCDKNSIQNGGNTNVEIKNVEELRKAYPDLVAQIENAAQANGVAAERQRIQGIEAIQSAIADQTMIADAKYGEKPLSAEQLAFKAMQAQAAIGATVLTKMEQDTKDSGTGAVEGAPNGGADPVVDEAAEAQKQIDEAVKAYNMLNGGKK
jgi:ATP-dependent Clp endopeptidase proteolytic subunit ClpP